MDTHTELTRRFWRMPLEATRTSVDLVTTWWAAGRFVPSRCTPQWVADLAVQADLAERVVACRLATLPDLVDALEPPQELQPGVN